MGLSDKQYNDIMFEYDRIRTRNRRTLDTRTEKLYKSFPELKKIRDDLAMLSIEQAKAELTASGQTEETRETYYRKYEELIRRKTEILAKAGYPKDFLDSIYTCTDCKDTGYINGKPCHCLQQKKIEILYSNSNLKYILEAENFNTFSEEYYDDTTVHENLSITPRENIRRIREICQNFIADFDKLYENILFYGPTGVGKTFLTHCIAKELLDSGHTVIYLTSLQLFDILEKNKFDKEEQHTTNEQITYILDSDLLIIDDLGTELSNSFTTSKLYYLMEERHSKRRSTIISTNLSFRDIRERYSERILSRFTGNYDIKQIVGMDIRIQKALQKKKGAGFNQ